MGAPANGQKCRKCCGVRRCILTKRSRNAVGHSPECAIGPDSLKQQDVFVAEATRGLIGRFMAVHDQLNLHNMTALPEKEQPTAVNDRGGHIFPSSQFEQADLKTKVVDPLDMEAPLKRSLRRALKKAGYTEKDYMMLPDALRLRVSVISEELCKEKMRKPHSLLEMAKGWIMREAAQGSRGKQRGLFSKLFKLVRAGKVVALSTGHTDAFQRSGYFHPDIMEVLTVFCTSKDPVYVLVVSTDLYKAWGKQLAQENLVDVQLYEVRDGQSIVMPGAAGQTCCHIVLGPVGSACLRLRSFWVPV